MHEAEGEQLPQLRGTMTTYRLHHNDGTHTDLTPAAPEASDTHARPWTLTLADMGPERYADYIEGLIPYAEMLRARGEAGDA